MDQQQTKQKRGYKDAKLMDGGAGYRSRYLSHAKRALYHLSYAPVVRVLTLFHRFESVYQGLKQGSNPPKMQDKV